MTANGRHVAVIILNWQGWQDTIDCCISILNGAYEDISIVICDNASKNNSLQHLQDWASDLQSPFRGSSYIDREAPLVINKLSYTRNGGFSELPNRIKHSISIISIDENLGYAGGNNVGMQFALNDDSVCACWILNNDVITEKHALTSAMSRLEADPNIGLVGSTILYHSNPKLVQCLGGGTFSRLRGLAHQYGNASLHSELTDHAKIESSLFFIHGAATLASRDFLVKIGLMNEEYFLYWEELDWAVRASGKFRLGFAPLSIVLHKVGASIGTNDFTERSALSEYYLTRNRVKFCAKYSKISLPYVLADVIRSISKWALKLRWDRVGLLISASLGVKPPRP